MTESATEQAWQPLDGLDPRSSDFPARARFDGEGIVIVRMKDGYRGVQRTCPHLHASMMDAELVGNGTMLRCRQHVFTYRLSDGRGVNCPGFSITVYEVKEEDGRLYARRRSEASPQSMP